MIRKTEARKALVLHQFILERTQRRYQSSNNEAKRAILYLVHIYNKLNRYGMGLFAKRSLKIPLNSKHPRNKSIKKTPSAKKSISEFPSRDDNSTVKTGDKATINRKRLKT